MKTVLNDRTLWYDGDSTVDEESIVRFLLSGKDISGLCVNEITAEIKRYNDLVPENKRIGVKEKVNTNFDTAWNIPDKYKTLDLEEYILDLFDSEMSVRGWVLDDKQHDVEAKKRIERVAMEINLFKNNELYDLLRTIIYIINTLREKDVVWGVGRGSSVSSYILYLIGVHDVDSVEFELDISDFIH